MNRLDLALRVRGLASRRRPEALVRDVLYAFRTFRRAPFAALTIVVTVALGLGLVTLVFGVYSTFFLRVDAVWRPGELYGVDRPAHPGSEAWLPFTRPEYEAMRRETGVFTDVFAMLRPGRTRVDGRPALPSLVTGNFFQVLGVQAVLGRTLTPGDGERAAGQAPIVLSHRGWNRLFAGDPAIVGRTVHINGLSYVIVGVMPDGFRGLGIGPPDYWAPLALAGQFREAYAGREDEIALDVVGRLKPGMSPEAAKTALTVWAAGRTDLPPSRAERASASLAEAFGGGGKTVPGQPTTIRLRPRQGTLTADALERLAVFSPIFFAFGLILMIGCANVANLLLARGVSRQREIGIRLSLGASRRRIIRQLLTESLLLALAAAACGLAVSRLFLDAALYAAFAAAPPELIEQVDLTRWAPVADWRVLVFLIAGAMVSTVSFGLVPALQATRFELVRTMRGEVTTDARPGRARQTLIAVQVGASALLLICAAIFLRGALGSAAVDPGVRTSDTVIIPSVNESRRAALLNALTTHPSVAVVAASSEKTLVVAETSASAETDASGRVGMSSRVPVDRMAVSPEYFDVLGIAVVRGRGFTQAERTAEASVAMVSETVARKLWLDRNAIGQVVRLQVERKGSPDARELSSRTFTVVGVVRDVAGGWVPESFSFRGVYVPTSPDASGTLFTLRVHGHPEAARQALVDRLTNVDPGLGTIITMRTLAGLPTYILGIAFWVTVVLGGLALVLTLSGLFSVLSYVVEQRAQEIGVRMALGATTRKVAALVLSQSMRPVGLGLVAGGGLAAALAMVLMSIASELGTFVEVFDPVAYAASAGVITAACLLAASVPALRAARIDPIAMLRKD